MCFKCSKLLLWSKYYRPEVILLLLSVIQQVEVYLKYTTLKYIWSTSNIPWKYISKYIYLKYTTQSILHFSKGRFRCLAAGKINVYEIDLKNCNPCEILVWALFWWKTLFTFWNIVLYLSIIHEYSHILPEIYITIFCSKI